MDDLKFDIYAMVEPKTESDRSALLDEALAELRSLNRTFDAIFEQSAPQGAQHD